MAEKYDHSRIYNRLWKCGSVQQPANWSLWKITKEFEGRQNLELGAGNCPRIPVKGGYFLDASEEAVRNLEALGGKAVLGDVVDLPFEANFFDLVAGFEVLEHVENDEKAFSEIARVLKPGGFFLFSVPLGQKIFNEFDLIAGHKRRYEIAELEKLLSKNGFKILKYRAPSFYVRILNSLKDSFLVLRMARHRRTKKSIEIFNPPQFVFNLHYRILSFLERKSAPKWKSDPKDLSRYKEKWIVMLCKKNE
jgi:SAM-dependent methyltransferase